MRLWENLLASIRERKKPFGLFRFISMISSSNFFFHTSYVSYFMLLNIVPATIKLSVWPRLLPVTHQGLLSYALSFITHTERHFPVPFEMKKKLESSTPSFINVTCWKSLEGKALHSFEWRNSRGLNSEIPFSLSHLVTNWILTFRALRYFEDAPDA